MTDSEKNSTQDNVPSAKALGGFYFLYLGALGSQASYLPLALLEGGLTLGEVSVVLLVPAVMRMVVPAVWGYWADRRGGGSGLLVVACWGAALTYLPILWSGEWGGVWAVGIIFGVHALFRLPVSALADALAFKRVSQTGGSYGEIRRWGTVGYILMVVVSGYLGSAVSLAWAVSAGVVLMVGAAMMAQTITRAATPSATARHKNMTVVGALKGLGGEPRFVLFLVAMMLHTVGQAGYDSYFSLHLEGLGVAAWVIGWAVALGAGVEVGVMTVSRRVIGWLGAERVCVGASLIAAARWWMNAHIESVWLLVGVQALHGITFGAWYVAAASLADQRAPDHLRTSAQGLLTVVSFGLGGVVAMVLGSVIQDTAAFFLLASLLALGAAVVMVISLRMGKTQERALRGSAVTGLVVLVLCCALGAGCQQGGGGDTKNKGGAQSGASDAKDEADAPAPVIVEVSPVVLGDVSETLFATGTLISQKQLTLLSEAAGVVAELKPLEGDLIEAPGAILGKIHNPDLDLTVRTAQNQIRRLEAELARLKPLLDKGFIPRADYDRSATELDIAREELTRARTAAQSMTLRASMRGVVSQRHVEVGAQVSPGQPLLTFVDIDALEARLQIPEYELGKLRLQMPAAITSQALGPPAFPAEVAALSPVVDPTSGTIRVTVRPLEVIRADGQRLRPGMFTQVHITTQARAGVPLIPRRALLFDDARPYVFVMRGNTAHRVTVRTGATKDDQIEVVEGLVVGDLVVTLGQAALRDGALIQLPSSPATPTPSSTSNTPEPDASSPPPDADTKQSAEN